MLIGYVMHDRQLRAEPESTQATVSTTHMEAAAQHSATDEAPATTEDATTYYVPTCKSKVWNRAPSNAKHAVRYKDSKYSKIIQFV